METEYILFLIAGAIAGGFVNGLAGFGTSLFALGWWLHVLPPVNAVALVLAMSVVSGLQGVWLVRRSIRPRRLGIFLVPALLGIPLGLMILEQIDAGALKITVAAFLLAYAGFFLFRKDLPNVKGEFPVTDAGIGFLGGILGAVAGLSGALPTMWLSCRAWPKMEVRAVLQPFNVIVLGISAALLALGGAFDRATLIAMAIVFPVTMVASQAGLWSFSRLDDLSFRRLLIGLMFVSGALIVARELA